MAKFQQKNSNKFCYVCFYKKLSNIKSFNKKQFNEIVQSRGDIYNMCPLQMYHLREVRLENYGGDLDEKWNDITEQRYRIINIFGKV